VDLSNKVIILPPLLGTEIKLISISTIVINISRILFSKVKNINASISLEIWKSEKHISDILL